MTMLSIGQRAFAEPEAEVVEVCTIRGRIFINGRLHAYRLRGDVSGEWFKAPAHKVRGIALGGPFRPVARLATVNGVSA